MYFIVLKKRSSKTGHSGMSVSSVECQKLSLSFLDASRPDLGECHASPCAVGLIAKFGTSLRGKLDGERCQAERVSQRQHQRDHAL
jgi:hypothetical protein